MKNIFHTLFLKFSNHKFASAKLKEMEAFVEVEGEDFQIGSPVYLVENETPTLVEGEMTFVLEDGRTIMTDEDGLISNILPAPTEEVETEEVEVEIEAEEVTPNPLEEKVAALEAKIAELESLLSMVSSLQNEFGEMKNKVEKLYSEPAPEKQKFSKKDENLTVAQRKIFNSLN
jgi:hypothetical protein